MFESISYSKLLKLELPELAERVMEIVETHNPEELLISDAFDLLVAQKPQIDALVVRHGPHLLTEKLEPLRQKRNLYATAISFQIRGYAKGYLSGDGDAIDVAKLEVNRYLLNLRSKNEEIINRRITQFLAEVGTNEDLSSAITSLGVTDHLANLELTHSKIRGLLKQRLQSISKRPKGKSETFAKSIRDAVKLLFMKIQVAHTFNTALDYKPMVDELNELLIRYKGLIKTRASYLKKTSEKPVETEYNQKLNNTTNIPEVSPLMCATMENGSEFNTGFNESIDEKKAVAKSTKHMQLPVLK